MKTLSSRGVYIRPLVMVAPPFIPECITPKCLAHGNEGEATLMTTVGILRPLIYIWWNSPSLIPLRHLRPSVMVAPSFRSRVHYTKLSSTRERRRSYPHDNSRDSSSSHIWWRLNRLKVNPKYRLIIFLKEDLASITSISEGAVTGTTAGMMEGLLDFCKNKNPISYH